MRPDRSRRPYPAFRAWLIRLVAYAATGMGVVVAAVVLLGRLLPAGVPPLLVLAVQVAAGSALAAVANHVVTVLLYARRQAAHGRLAVLRQADGRGRRGLGCRKGSSRGR